MANDDLDAVILRAGARLGYTAIYPNQHKAVKSFIEGSKVFISLPTESAKSFCYVFDGLYQRVGSIVIVVSPLIALMKDQVRRLHAAEPRVWRKQHRPSGYIHSVYNTIKLQLQIGHHRIRSLLITLLCLLLLLHELQLI